MPLTIDEFLKPHSNFVLKKSYPLEKKRVVLTLEQIDGWFLLLRKVIQENDLENRPAQIFNCDESGKFSVLLKECF